MLIITELVRNLTLHLVESIRENEPIIHVHLGIYNIFVNFHLHNTYFHFPILI